MASSEFSFIMLGDAIRRLFVDAAKKNPMRRTDCVARVAVMGNSCRYCHAQGLRCPIIAICRRTRRLFDSVDTVRATVRLVRHAPEYAVNGRLVCRRGIHLAGD